MTENQKAEIYLPSVAEFPKDLQLRHELLSPARIAGYRTGLMLVVRPDSLTKEAISKQLNNLDLYIKLPTEERPLVFVMHPNMPLTGDRKLNLLTNGNYTQETVEHSIMDLVSKLPDEVRPEGGHKLTFHLNTLITPNEWKSDKDFWSKEFEGVLKRVKEMSDFGKRHGVNIAIETTPVPEFGDVADKELKYADDGKTYWSQLGNPWPLLFWRDEIKKVRQAGSGVAIDFCHSYIAMRTIADIPEKKKEELDRLMVYPGDVEPAREAVKDFSKEILTNTEKHDVWHVNDAQLRKGKRSKNKPDFVEGVALFEGEIPVKDLSVLVKEGLDKPVKYVIEVNETDFASSPNTKKSLTTALKG